MEINTAFHMRHAPRLLQRSQFGEDRVDLSLQLWEDEFSVTTAGKSFIDGRILLISSDTSSAEPPISARLICGTTSPSYFSINNTSKLTHHIIMSSDK